MVWSGVAEIDRCYTDHSGKGWTVERSDLSDDLNLEGQGRWAEHIRQLLKKAQLAPAR